MSPRARHRRGFTLAEVLVTIVVVGTALVVVSQGITLGLRGSAHAEVHTEATTLFDEVVARLETGEISLTENSEGELADVVAGYRYAVEVETPGEPAGLVHAHITVRWGADDRGRDPVGALSAHRWFYRADTSTEGGVTRGPQVGSAAQGGAR